MVDIELEPCPDCRGTGLLEYEEGWCVWAECSCCGTKTTFLTYKTDEEKAKAERASMDLWNARKVIHARPGE